MSSIALGAQSILSVADAGSAATGDGRSGFSSFATAAFQVSWEAISGTPGGTLKLQCSIDGTNYSDKSGASAVISGTSGSTIISIVSITEEFYRAVWTPNGETGGVVAVVATASRRS